MSTTEIADVQPALVRLLRATYPHADFPDGPYQRTADAILATAQDTVWQQLMLVQGLATLPAEMSEKQLRDIADVPFFAYVRAQAIPILYSDREVWDILGYEGESFDQGGYLERGFNDLDWLPEPRIEEYDGPEKLVVVAEPDQLARGDQ